MGSIGEPLVKISEDLIYFIYLAAHAKSLKHFFFSSGLSMCTVDDTVLVLLVFLKLHLPVYTYFAYFYALSYKYSNVRDGIEASGYTIHPIGRATQSKLAEEQSASV